MDVKVRKKILIVDDEEMNRELLRHIFTDSYEVVMAKDGKEAIEKVSQFKKEIAVILLDLIMPVMNGYQVLQLLHADTIIQKIPVVLISANTDIRIAISCYSLGAIDVIYKPFIPEVVRRRVDNVVKIYQREEALAVQLQEKEQQMEDFYDQFIETLGNLVEFRGTGTSNHIDRVKNLTKLLATTYKNLYPEDNLSQEEINMISRFSALHDIGKISVPDNILLKPGKLTPDELEVAKSHTTRGCDILEEIENMKDSPYYKMAYDIIRYHHERYDGKGYPEGLVGDAIPLSAQLVSIVDVFDNLVNERIYKKAYSNAKAYEMIKSGECGEFSPKIIKSFEQARKAIEYYSDTH